jgi:glycyl-tRNA synthetase
MAGSREAFRVAVANTLERRLFYVPSFKIYGGVAGLYDYGPPGCAVKANVLAFWRQVASLLLLLQLVQSVES